MHKKLNVLIFTGGSGSVQLQTAIYREYSEVIEPHFIINMFDNGLSTGAVRKVFDNKILGPSDLRKNQLLQHKLIHGNTLLLEVFEERFTKSNDEVKDYCLSKISKLENYFDDKSYYQLLEQSINRFFNNNNWNTIEYTDFSISNIIYASLLNMFIPNIVAKMMSELLEIPNNIAISSEEPLFLKATTSDGQIVDDEADIVDLKNVYPNSKIKDVFFEDCYGNVKQPLLSTKALEYIRNADIIIFSSGTQWSSLIPTYVSELQDTTFFDSIKESSASKYLVMNNICDNDMPNVSSNEILNILDDYLPLDDITIVLNKNASEVMREIPDTPYILNELSESVSKRHNGFKLINTILYDNFKLYHDKYIFDYDDTLVSRDKSLALNRVSLSNRALLNSIYNDILICSGNSINKLDQIYHNHPVLADGGVVLYDKNPSGLLKKYVDGDLLISVNSIEQSIKEILDDNEYDYSNLEFINKSNVMLSIKPVIDRDELIELVDTELFHNNSPQDIVIRKAGRTTVEISREECNKFTGLSNYCNTYYNYVYFGDELDNGNDECVKDIKNITCVDSDIFKCNIVLRLLIEQQEGSFIDFINNSSR